VHNHNQNYLSTDCNIKLNCKIFEDSSLAKKKGVDEPNQKALLKMFLDQNRLKWYYKKWGSTLQYSISSDASNKGNRNFFLLIVTYFDKNVGMKYKIIDFYKDDYSDSKAIYKIFRTSLQEANLLLVSITPYSVDNASVNYGQYNSVYQKLLADIPALIKSNCNCHVIHNAGKFACGLIFTLS
jgi:hypothetical protein